MKPLSILGVALILAGGAALFVGSVSYTTEKPVLDIGPLKASVSEDHTIPLPQLAGMGLIVLGGALLVFTRRSV